MQKKRLSPGDTATLIRTTLTEMFGEVAATTALSFTGDGADGIEGFAQRAKELYGNGAFSIFERIANAATGPTSAGLAEEPKQP